MKTRIPMCGLLITAIVILGSAALSYGENTTVQSGSNAKPGMGMHQKAPEEKGGMIKDLNLTPEQQEKLKNHREANREKVKQLRDQMQEKRLALKNELEKSTLNKTKIKSLTSDIKNLFGQLLDLQVDGVIFVKETLTAEQFAKFQQKIKEQKDKKMGSGKGGPMQERMRPKPGQRPEGPDAGKTDNP